MVVDVVVHILVLHDHHVLLLYVLPHLLPHTILFSTDTFIAYIVYIVYCKYSTVLLTHLLYFTHPTLQSNWWYQRVCNQAMATLDKAHPLKYI